MPPALSEYDSDEEYEDGIAEPRLEAVSKEDCFRFDDVTDGDTESEAASVAPTATTIRTVERKSTEFRVKDCYESEGDDASESDSSTASRITSGTPPSAQHQAETDEEDDDSSPMPQRFMPKGKTPAMLAGLDLHNIIYVSDDEVGSTDYYTPPTSSVHTTRQQVRGGPKVDLQYNRGYHPLDDYLHPKRAAKVKLSYDAVNHVVPELTDSNSDPDQESLHLEPDSESEEVDRPNRKTKASKDKESAARRSAHAVTQSHSVYDMSIHPQDKELSELGILSKRKRRLVETSDDEEEEHQNHRRRSRKARVSARPGDRHLVSSRPQKRTTRPESVAALNDEEEERSNHRKNHRKVHVSARAPGPYSAPSLQQKRTTRAESTASGDEEEDQTSAHKKHREIRVSAKARDRYSPTSLEQKRATRPVSVTSSRDATNGDSSSTETPVYDSDENPLGTDYDAPGQRYYPHEDISLFDGQVLLQGGAFKIHEESMAVQHAAESNAQPTKLFIDFPKENMKEPVENATNTHSSSILRAASGVLVEMDAEVDSQLLHAQLLELAGAEGYAMVVDGA